VFIWTLPSDKMVILKDFLTPFKRYIPSSLAASSRLPSFWEVSANVTSEEVSAKTLSYDLFDSILAKRSE